MRCLNRDSIVTLCHCADLATVGLVLCTSTPQTASNGQQSQLHCQAPHNHYHLIVSGLATVPSFPPHINGSTVKHIKHTRVVIERTVRALTTWWHFVRNNSAIGPCNASSPATPLFAHPRATAPEPSSVHKEYMYTVGVTKGQTDGHSPDRCAEQGSCLRRKRLLAPPYTH